MGKPYRVCGSCDANLDAGEICDCKWEQEAAKIVAVCKDDSPPKAQEQNNYSHLEAG